MSESKEIVSVDSEQTIQVSLRAYTKILSHVVQYPYTAVNGVLLSTGGQ